jgi:hypothetical protein
VSLRDEDQGKTFDTKKPEVPVLYGPLALDAKEVLVSSPCHVLASTECSHRLSVAASPTANTFNISGPGFVDLALIDFIDAEETLEDPYDRVRCSPLHSEDCVDEVFPLSPGVQGVPW